MLEQLASSVSVPVAQPGGRAQCPPQGRRSLRCEQRLCGDAPGSGGCQRRESFLRFGAQRGAVGTVLEAPAHHPPPVTTAGGGDAKKGRHLVKAAHTGAPVCTHVHTRNNTRTHAPAPRERPSSCPCCSRCPRLWRAGMGARGTLVFPVPRYRHTPIPGRNAACAARLFTPGCSRTLTCRV